MSLLDCSAKQSSEIYGSFPAYYIAELHNDLLPKAAH